MRFVVIGGTGLIGAATVARLTTLGHDVIAVARRAGAAGAAVRWLELDIGRLTPPDWIAHLVDVDVVVNCAGALQQGPGDDLRAVHVDGPVALFRACERAGVKRIVHVSAIGAEREALTRFSATKREAERALEHCSVDWVVLRPSVVLGRSAYGGSGLLRGLAVLPVSLEMPSAGSLQVVQLDDVVDAIVHFSDQTAPAGVALDVAGPERLAFADVVAAYRCWLGYREARRLHVPRPVAALVHAFGDAMRTLGWRPPLGHTARDELARGAVGDPRPWIELTGAAPKTLAAALASEPASVQERWFARLYFAKPLVLVVFAGFWIATGVVSLLPGWDAGLAYLGEGGVTGALARGGVVAGALADLAIGIGIAIRRTARVALYAALAISVFYMVVGTAVLPTLWTDPVGPMLKIWPILALNVVALAILPDR